MSVNLARLSHDHGMSCGIRRGVAAGVILLHALALMAVWRSGVTPVAASGRTVMVSFVAASREETVAPPEPAAPVPETSPVLATERQTPVMSAPAPVAEPAEAPVAVPATSSADAVAAPPADVAVPAATSAIVTPPSFGAAYLSNPKPAYPLASRRLREEGITILRVQVSAEGRPQQILVEHSSGSSRLDVAAKKVVRDWRFVPAREGDIAITDWVTVPINWKLDN